MKKLLSFLLIAALLVSAFPLSLTSYAEEGEPQTAGQLKLYDSFTLGYWPQSSVTDVDLIAALDSQPAELRSFGYTYGSATQYTQLQKANYAGFADIQYADIDYNGCRYRKVVSNSWRPSDTLRSLSTSNLNGTHINYYKWEPIEWIVCQVGESGVVATPHYILDEQPVSYSQDDPVSWENSFLRDYLNIEFYNYAFSAAEQQKLCEMEKFGTTDLIIIPSVGDLAEGGMLYGHYMNTGYSCAYALMAGAITLDKQASQRKLNWVTLSDDGANVYRVLTSGGAVYDKTEDYYKYRVDGIKPVITIANDTVLPGSEAIENYSTEHVHHYLRKISAPGLAASELVDCEDNRPYFYTCLTCDAHGSDTFIKKKCTSGHTLEQVLSFAALDEWIDEESHYASFFYTCSVCGKVIKEKSDGTKAKTFNANFEHEHLYEKVVKNVAPTCTEPGYTTYRCKYTGCTADKQVDKPALGHQPFCDISEEALCTEKTDDRPATYYYTCERCGEVLKTNEDGSPAPTFEYDEQTHEHSYQLIASHEPTCTEGGYKEYRCSVCGDTYKQDTLPALGHDDHFVEHKDPTCKVKGYDKYACERCGRYRYTYIDKVDHDFSAQSDTFVMEPTCTENGYAAYACIYCGLVNEECTYEVEGSMLRHDYSKVVSTQALCTPASYTAAATYYYTCSMCGVVIKDLEGYETRTFSYGEPLHYHQYEVVETIEPDCLHAGILVYKCIQCEDTYEEEYAEPLGHDYQFVRDVPATCTVRGRIIYKCSRCNRSKSEYYGDKPLGHQYTVRSDEVYREPTCTQDGLYYLTCSGCGIKSNDYIYQKEGSALGHTYTKVCSAATLRTHGEAGKPATYYYTCGVCQTILKGDEEPYFTADIAGSALADYQQGYTFEMGVWPQSLVTDEAMIAELDDQYAEMNLYGFGFGESRKIAGVKIDNDIWYLKAAGLVDMQYGDIFYHGAKYRKVVVNNARINYKENQYQNNNHTFDGTYYFKWEPITWRVIEQGDGTTTAVSDMVLDYAYHVYENYNGANWLNEYFRDLAFTAEEQQAFATDETLNLCSTALFQNNKQYFETNKDVYLAPASHYSLLMGSNSMFLGSNRSNATVTWRVGEFTDNDNEHKVTADGSVTYAYYIEDQGIRVKMVFDNSFVPTGAENISRYPAEHTHKYIRMMHVDEALVEVPTCRQPEQYYYSCIGCGAICNDRYETMEDGYIDHIESEVISDAALKTPATETTDAVYYYTCATCGQVLKTNHTFTLAGTHTGEHQYKLNRSKSTATCTKPGYLYYECSICGTSYKEEVTEPSHSYEFYQNVQLTPQNCQNAGTYCKQYRCTFCGNLYTDESEIYYKPGGGNGNFHAFTTLVSQVKPTCTQNGENVYQCKYCDVTNTIKVEALGHNYTSKAKNGYTIKQAATCGSNAIYYYSCSRCGEPCADCFEDIGSALSHDFTKQVMNEHTRRTSASSAEGDTYYYTCMHCGKIDYREDHFFTTATYKGLIKDVATVGSNITYGSWPQSRVTNSALLAQLEEQPITLKSYGYRYTPNMGTYYNDIDMSYGDVTLGGERYRKVVIDSYRPYHLDEAPLSGNSFQPLNGYVQGSYWFKWEPIEWKVLQIENGEALLVAENVIDAQFYMDDFDAAADATWAQSAVRSWLNETFYEQAFNAQQKAGIIEDNLETLGNYEYGTSGGAATRDRLFIPEQADFHNKIMYLYTTKQRQTAASDYAVSQGLWMNGDAYAEWMTRTPSVGQKGIVTVSGDGNQSDSFKSTLQLTGVKPMMRLNIYADYKKPDFNGDGTVDFADFSAILSHIGKSAEGNLAIYDLNDNGCIDSQDISILLLSEYYGKIV
ncbi:MAG: hypothetical protein IJI67_09235 [Clostridia bacterium]|nr:hypothetical protein [Clostridia bacterium]